MSLATAIARVETWSVSGVTNTTYVQQQPIPGAALPALILELSYSYEGMRSIAVNFQTGAAVFHPRHLLLFSLINQSDKTKLSSLVGKIDLYLAAAADDLRLNNTLMEPLAILTSDVGPIPFMGYVYFGCVFQHRWVMKVT